MMRSFFELFTLGIKMHIYFEVSHDLSCDIISNFNFAPVVFPGMASSME